LSACFAHYGAKPKNPRWSWSARSADDRTVVLTIWQDQIKGGPDKTVVVDDFETERREWVERPGNRERLENLVHARDHCDVRFRVVIVRPADTNAEPRTIADCFPLDRLTMQITELNEQIGEFRAVSVPVSEPR